MDLGPTAMPIARIRQGWPGMALPRAGMPLQDPARNAAQTAEVAHKFETLIAETLLRSARAADLGDDGLGESGSNIREMIDHGRAEAIARAAPMGVARLLARDATGAGIARGAALAPDAATSNAVAQ